MHNILVAISDVGHNRADDLSTGGQRLNSLLDGSLDAYDARHVTIALYYLQLWMVLWSRYLAWEIACYFLHSVEVEEMKTCDNLKGGLVLLPLFARSFLHSSCFL